MKFYLKNNLVWHIVCPNCSTIFCFHNSDNNLSVNLGETEKRCDAALVCKNGTVLLTLRSYDDSTQIEHYDIHCLKCFVCKKRALSVNLCGQ